MEKPRPTSWRRLARHEKGGHELTAGRAALNNKINQMWDAGSVYQRARLKLLAGMGPLQWHAIYRFGFLERLAFFSEKGSEERNAAAVLKKELPLP